MTPPREQGNTIIYFKRVKEINLKEQENDIFTINGTLTNYFREQWNLFIGSKGEKSEIFNLSNEHFTPVPPPPGRTGAQ